MFILYADKNKLTVRRREPVTSGSVNVYSVRFEFSSDWDGMDRVAVFKAGAVSRSQLLDETNTCEVPWEVLTKPSVQLQAGVCGQRGEEEVLPTIWASLGMILEGAIAGEAARPPTPDLWEQELSKKGDRLGLTKTGEVGLYAGDKLLSSVKVSGSGAGGDWGVGHGLKIVDGDLAVDTVDDFNGDNTLPMTAAGVQTTVGNIEELLKAIRGV